MGALCGSASFLLAHVARRRGMFAYRVTLSPRAASGPTSANAQTAAFLRTKRDIAHGTSTSPRGKGGG